MAKTKKNAKKNSKQSYMEKKAAIAQLTSSKNSVRVRDTKTDYEPCSTITVKNAEGDADTVAQILIQNKIDYTPKVSVVIPVYNVEPYLRQCLDSVINQTLKEIEIICVDDGSTDASLDILKEYATKDNRITVITQKNLYAGVARNAGLSQAKGEYLSFLDSDDFFELNMLEESYYKATKEKIDIVVWRSREYDTKTKEYRNVVGPVSPQLFKYVGDANTVSDFGEKLFQANGCVPWNKLISLSLVHRLNIHLAILCLKIFQKRKCKFMGGGINRCWSNLLCSLWKCRRSRYNQLSHHKGSDLYGVGLFHRWNVRKIKKCCYRA